MIQGTKKKNPGGCPPGRERREKKKGDSIVGNCCGS